MIRSDNWKLENIKSKKGGISGMMVNINNDIALSLQEVVKIVVH